MQMGRVPASLKMAGPELTPATRSTGPAFPTSSLRADLDLNRDLPIQLELGSTGHLQAL
jgi:hypothetical protein